jgi:hypothetical protein
MPRLLPLAICALLAFALVACSGGDKSDDEQDATATPAERTSAPSDGDGDSDLAEYEDDLRETAPAAVTALFAGGAVDAYGYASSAFKENCSLDDFLGVTALVKVFLGDLEPDDVSVTVGDITYEGERAFVELDMTLAGESLEGDSEEGGFGDFWVREDGEWKFSTDDADPCDTGFEEDVDDEPATGPGRTRDEAIPVGEPVEIDDLRVTVIESDVDADDRLPALSEFDATPVPGTKSVLVRVTAEHTGTSDDETVEIYESSFALTGSNNVVYESFSDSSCGFLEDTVDAELFPGGEVEGYVCFRVPVDETGLILIVEPFFALDDDARRFMRLE